MLRFIATLTPCLKEGGREQRMTSRDQSSAQGLISNLLEHPFQRRACEAKAPGPAATNQPRVQDGHPALL